MRYISDLQVLFNATDLCLIPMFTIVLGMEVSASLCMLFVVVKSLAGSADPTGWMKIVTLACTCLKKRRKERPLMSEVNQSIIFFACIKDNLKMKYSSNVEICSSSLFFSLS